MSSNLTASATAPHSASAGLRYARAYLDADHPMPAPRAHSDCIQRARYVAMAFLASCLIPLRATSAAPSPVPVESRPASELGPLIITATRQPTREADTPASVTVVRAEDVLDGQHRINLSEALARVPGVFVQNRHNYAQDLQVSSRGFGSRASFGIRGLRLYVDDVPVTFPDGQGQGAVIPLAAVQTIEVLRGPWAGAYGNSAGGVIQVNTQPVARSPRWAIDGFGGPDAMQRLGFRASGSTDMLAGYLDANRFSTAGFRAHSATRRTQLFSRVEIPLSWGLSTSNLVLTGIALDQPGTQDPLGLADAEWRASPRSAGANAVLFNTRKSVRHRQIGATLNAEVGQQTWRLTGYAGTREVEQYLATSVAAQSSATSSGGVVDLSREFGGMQLSTSGSALRTLWTAGLEWDSAVEQRRGFENFVGVGASTRLGVRGRERRNEESRTNSAAAYLQTRGDLSDRVAWMGSVRTSRISMRTDDRFIAPANPDDSGVVTYRAQTPSAGFTYTASPTTQLTASFGVGMETPTAAELAYRADGSAGLNFALRPSRSRQFESGVRWQPGATTFLRIVSFEIQSENEIVPALSIGGRASFQNAGATRRRGIEVGLEHSSRENWSANLALTHLDARFVAPFTQASAVGGASVARTIPTGNRIPATPPSSAFVELAWRKGMPGTSLALEANARSALFADDANSVRAPGHVQLNLRLMVAGGWSGRRVQTFLRVDNLAKVSSVGSVIVNEANGRFFEPSPGRRLSLGVSITHP